MFCPHELKQWRIEAGLSQLKLGHMLGIAPDSVRRYEDGRRTPDADTAMRIDALIAGRPTLACGPNGEDPLLMRLMEVECPAYGLSLIHI